AARARSGREPCDARPPGAAPRPRRARARLGSRRERRRFVEKPPEGLRLEQAAPPRRGVRQLELLEDRARPGAPPRLAAAPLVLQPAPQLLVALARAEDAPHDELR